MSFGKSSSLWISQVSGAMFTLPSKRPLKRVDLNRNVSVCIQALVWVRSAPGLFIINVGKIQTLLLKVEWNSSMGPHSHQTESQSWSIWSSWWMTDRQNFHFRQFIFSTCSTAGLSQPTEPAVHRDHGSHLCLGLLNATHRLSALLCITSETALWRFQCVFDPLLEAEWSFLFHNISHCFRTYHSAAIICGSPEGISFLLLSHFIEGQRSGSITQPVAAMTPDDSVFCSVEVRKQEDLIVVEIHGLHLLITLPSIRPCSRVQEASHQGPFHSWRQFLMHLYSHAMPLCTP